MLICPIMSQRILRIDGGMIECEEENCALYDKEKECCCIKSMADNMLKNNESLYIRSM